MYCRYKAYGVSQPFIHPIERNVVIARHNDLRSRRQSIEKRPGGGELVRFGSLREIAAGHDHVGMNVGRGPQQGLANLGPIRRPKVEIGNLQQGQHLKSKHQNPGSASPARRVRRSRLDKPVHRKPQRALAPNNGRTSRSTCRPTRSELLEHSVVGLFDPAATRDLLADVTDDRLTRGDAELRLVEAAL